MRTLLLLAILLLSGCTGMDWAASDAACEKRLGQPGEDGLPAQLDARDLGAALRGSGPISLHCDALQVQKGGDYVLDDVDGRIRSVTVAGGGTLEIRSSRLLASLHAHAGANLTLRDTVVHVSGFMVILDFGARVRLERVAFVPDPFFQGYMLGAFGGRCDAPFGPPVPWHLEDVHADGVWEAALSVGTVRNTTLSEPEQRESKACLALAPDAKPEGLTLHVDAFEARSLGGDAPATLRGVSGRIGQAMLHGEGQPTAWLLDDWPSRTGVAKLQVEGWAAMEGPLVPVEAVEPGAVVFTDEAGASAACSAGPGAVVGQGRWAHAAYDEAAPAGIDPPTLWLAYVAGTRQETGPVPIPYGAMDRDVPALDRACVGGALGPVESFEAMVRLGGTLGCARHEGAFEEVEFRAMVDGPDPEAACAARMALPA